MFGIVTTVLGLSLALGAGVSGLTLLAPVFHDAVVRMEVARDLNEGSQIEGAVMLRSFTALGSSATSGDLVSGGYLKEIPPGWTLTASGPQKALSGTQACSVLNEAGSGSSAPAPCPVCPAATSPSTPACLADGVPVYRPA